ncbi:MAG: KH domain-containing protein [Armatimonadetes bacterium]|nr:KH domain-containing protein [Armatimonadota bacterium]
MSEQEMEPIEISASTIDEALAQAAAQLGTDTSSLKYTVVDESKGLFGKGQVRVRVEASGSAKPKEKKARAPKVEAVAAAVVEVPAEEAVEEAPAAKPARPKRGKTEKPEAATKAERSEVRPKRSENNGADGAEVVATQKDADRIGEMFEAVLDASGLDVTATVSDVSGKYVNIKLGGKDVSHLVGRRGEVLNALQYLMNVAVSRQLDNGVRVAVDGNDYRRKRADELEKFAMGVAEEVKKRGEEAVLDALPAFERRLIHQALAEFEGVVTYSEGEEPDRRVVIAPAEAVS